ncbi:hypothetical protein [Enterococcus crotali]|uniref:hypothetical protein n=1 Tax=Enterococcus crotali TaxID=1453587 RepID=UPI0004708080|nr:hypothetical protein [Enterococcus crotali]
MNDIRCKNEETICLSMSASSDGNNVHFLNSVIEDNARKRRLSYPLTLGVTQLADYQKLEEHL